MFTKGEKIALGLVVVELVLIGVGQYCFKKEVKRRAMEQYGTDNLDEVLKIKSKEQMDKMKNNVTPIREA